MNGGMQVFPTRPGRACVVVGARTSVPELRALEAWMTERVDVTRVEYRVGSGALFAAYDDRAALAGRFLRSLRDRVWVANRARRPIEAFHVEVVHSLHGRVRLRVAGLHERELATLTMVIGGLRGVKRAGHRPGSRTMLVIYDVEELTEGLILEAIWKSDSSDWTRDWHMPTPVRWGGALTCTTVLLACLTRAVPFPLLAAGVTVSSLRPLRRALAALQQGRTSIDLLDVAATFAALATGRAATAAFVIWMVGVGDLLLDASASNARSAVSMLMRRREQEALRLLPTGSTEAVRVEDLRVGDRFVVDTEHAIVADGRIVSGSAAVDEKALTGESHLLSKTSGDRVFASTVVVEGRLVVEVGAAGASTEAAKIERVLNTVGSKPFTLQRDALDLGSKLVLPTLGVAWLAAALTSDPTRAVCVLITDFGTGIRISVPTSALTAVSLAAREGVLVKGAQYLERLSRADVVVFDKTGTLTSGMPEVVEVVTARGFREATMMRLCASAEAGHDHPVARALKAYAEARGLRLVKPAPCSEEYVVGLGLGARVEGRRVRVGRPAWMDRHRLTLGPAFKRHLARFRRERTSSLCVAVDGRIVGLVAYSDGTRPESAAIVKKLRGGGRRRVVLLSGDSPSVVESVAREVGIDEACGGLLPDQKAEYVRRLRTRGHVVAMVGDGINDAPALASADVGISIAGSTDVALETADVVLLEGGLSLLERTFAMSDQAMSSVRRNLGIVIAPNAVAIALGALGLIRPPLAAVINNGATILAVLAGTTPLLARRARRRSPAGEEEPV
jgi:Cu2+-exporting ATPase